MPKRAHSLIILYRPDGRILLQHRTEDAPRLPGYWACFGGGIEEGETPEQALARECLEEIEYKVRGPKLMFTEHYEQEGAEVTSYEFIEPYDESQTIILHEGQGYGWFTLEEALKLKISDRRRVTLQRIREFLPK